MTATTSGTTRSLDWLLTCPARSTAALVLLPQCGLCCRATSHEQRSPTNLVIGGYAAGFVVWHASRSRARCSEGRIGAGGDAADPNMDYLAVHVYDNKPSGGSTTEARVVPRRKFYPRNPLVRGTYSNNPHSLVRFDVKPGRHAYTLCVSQYKRLRTIDFSLFVYSMAPVTLTAAHNPFHEVYVDGEWTPATSGGNPRHSGFFDNPQFTLTLPKPTVGTAGDLTIRLEAPVAFASQVRVLATEGKRACDAKSLSLEVASSGDYRHGFSCAEAAGVEHGSYVPCSKRWLRGPGHSHVVAVPRYVVLVSAFKPGSVGRFRLIAGYSHGVPKLKPTGELGAGMCQRTVKGRWSAADGTAAGCPNHHNYTSNPCFVLKLRKSSSMFMRLRVRCKGSACEHWDNSDLAVLFPGAQHDGAAVGKYVDVPRASRSSATHT